MNKWQIICPVTALALVAIFGLVSLGRREHRAYVIAQTRMIGVELTRGTNSPWLAEIKPALRARLAEFLTSKVAVAEVLPGDEPAPVGDGTACSRLILSNNVGERIGIRLQQDAGPERFHALGFWTITELQHGADPSQSFRPQ
jgi:hypothetical protein